MPSLISRWHSRPGCVIIKVEESTLVLLVDDDPSISRKDPRSERTTRQWSPSQVLVVVVEADQVTPKEDPMNIELRTVFNTEADSRDRI